MRDFIRRCGPLLALLLGCSRDRGAQPGDLPEQVVAADDVHVVGTSDAISRVVDVAEESTGTIWVLNAAEPFLIAMQPDGKALRTWGRRGGGPSEFRNPNTLVPDPLTGKLWLYDRGRHAFLRVDGPEDPVEAITIPREGIPSGRVASMENLGAGNARVWIRSVGGEFLFAVSHEGSSPFTRLWSTDLVLLGSDGSTRVAYPIGSTFGDPATRYGAGVTEFLPYPLWTHCPDGSVATYDPLSNQIRRLSGDSQPADSVSLPAERRLEITMDRLFRMAFTFLRDQAPAGQRPDSATMYANLTNQWAEIQARSSPVFPEYADLQCSAPNTLWLQRFDPDEGMMGRSSRWLRIGASGDMSRLRLPSTFRPLRFEADRVLGTHRGEYDIESIAWLPLRSGSIPRP